MIPSTKVEELEQSLASTFGFDRRESIAGNRCVPAPIGCGGDATSFRDDLSRKEFTISGLCQKCQDKFFGETELSPDTSPDEWISDGYQMFSGQAEAAAHRYNKYVGKSGRTWLVADTEAAAENIYVTNNPQNTTSRCQGFEGFGGATLSFECVDGTVFAAHGPWHTNADSLLADTDIDVRDRYRTFVVLAKERDFTSDHRTVMRGIVYRDQEPVLGRFDRYKELIKQYPDAVCYYMESKGGSNSGQITEQDRRQP